MQIWASYSCGLHSLCNSGRRFSAYHVGVGLLLSVNLPVGIQCMHFRRWSTQTHPCSHKCLIAQSGMVPKRCRFSQADAVDKLGSSASSVSLLKCLLFRKSGDFDISYDQTKSFPPGWRERFKAYKITSGVLHFGQITWIKTWFSLNWKVYIL